MIYTSDSMYSKFIIPSNVYKEEAEFYNPSSAMCVLCVYINVCIPCDHSCRFMRLSVISNNSLREKGKCSSMCIYLSLHETISDFQQLTKRGGEMFLYEQVVHQKMRRHPSPLEAAVCVSNGLHACHMCEYPLF